MPWANFDGVFCQLKSVDDRELLQLEKYLMASHNTRKGIKTPSASSTATLGTAIFAGSR